MTSPIKVDIDASQVQGIVEHAILTSLDADARERVIKAALSYLTTEVRDGMYSRATPLQQAFNAAVQGAARTAVEELIQSDPRIKAAIDDMLGPLVRRLVDEDSWSGMVDAIGESIGRGIVDYYRDHPPSR